MLQPSSKSPGSFQRTFQSQNSKKLKKRQDDSAEHVQPYSIYDRPPEYGKEEETEVMTTRRKQKEHKVDLNIEQLRAVVRKKDVNILDKERLKKSPQHQKLVKVFRETIQAMIDDQITKQNFFNENQVTYDHKGSMLEVKSPDLEKFPKLQQQCKIEYNKPEK